MMESSIKSREIRFRWHGIDFGVIDCKLMFTWILGYCFGDFWAFRKLILIIFRIVD